MTHQLHARWESRATTKFYDTCFIRYDATEEQDFQPLGTHGQLCEYTFR